MPKQTVALSEAEVDTMVTSVRNAAKKSNLAVTVAVVDAGGHILALARMENARTSTVNVAVGKAWTAALFQRPSRAYQELTGPTGDAYGLWNANPGRMVPVPGGYPVFWRGTCIGGVGVSGGSGDDDERLAMEAAATVERTQ